ncbi:ABC transporter substrate-binding protein [Salinarimonas rosea]|uniref:ABC transporter substrate-binding protein n=1 Tax=Salinarimonas rosea TaxID=552063 RepID=UPI0003F6DBCE|nr:ABC transporter substrate-binding protein [Salinarimonas rosea]
MIRLSPTRRTLLAIALLAGTALVVAPPAIAADPAPLVVAKTFVAESLDPIDGSAGWALISHGIAEGLFTVSREGTVVPLLAERAERRDDGAWIVTLAEGRMYSDGTPVHAEGVAAAQNRTGDRNPAARASAGRLTFTALDPRTLLVETERPTPILPSILAEWAFPAYRQTDAGPVFTGPYAVASFEPGARIALEPNPHYPGAEARAPIDLRHVGDGQAMALALASGELDLAFNLPVETLSMLRARDGVTVRSFPVAYQYMMFMNTREGPLADVAVRRAIDRAIDRTTLVAAIRAGRPATGAFAEAYPFAADVVPALDPEGARRQLEEAGWTLGADGVRSKDGVRLVLDLVAYPQRPDLVTLQPVLRAALAEIGIGATTRVTELPNEIASSGDFDLLLWAQHTAPAGDPAFFLSLFLGSEGARNYAGWSSGELDALVAALASAEDPAERIRLAREAQAVAAADAPVAHLVTPEWHVGLSGRLAGYEPWGSDNYVIRPDLLPAD